MITRGFYKFVDIFVVTEHYKWSNMFFGRQFIVCAEIEQVGYLVGYEAASQLSFPGYWWLSAASRLNIISVECKSIIMVATRREQMGINYDVAIDSNILQKRKKIPHITQISTASIEQACFVNPSRGINFKQSFYYTSFFTDFAEPTIKNICYLWLSYDIETGTTCNSSHIAVAINSGNTV